MYIPIMRYFDRLVGVPALKITRLLSGKKKIPKNPKRILIIKLFGFGNFIFLSPVFKNLKRMFPDAQIEVLTFTQNKEICDMYGLKAHTLRFRVRYLGFDILRFAAKNRNKFDLAIDYEQFVRLSAIAGRMVDPSFFIGLCTKNSKKQAAYDLAIDYAEKNHVVEEFYDPVRRIAKMSGKKIDEKPSLFPPVFKESFLAKSSIKKIKALPIIGVCPGGRADDAERRYPKEKIAEALNKISEKKKVSFAFFGSKSEQEDIRFIISLMKDKKNCHDFSGLKLQDSAALISKTKIFISNDTGPLHLAASLGIFCVGLFGPSKEWIYGPYTDKRIILRDKKHKPIRSNHNEKNTGWPIEWWPEPELVADSVISTLEKSRLRK